ncbi:Thiol-disulfide isomerase or thioredoxin [bacterium A37T11]|nr:Thiol-disulfide isomerase or thioredoxin [bacterium A37T11]
MKFMIKRKIYTLWFMLAFSVINQQTYAQDAQMPLQLLDSGQMMPDMTLPITKYSSSSLRLRDLRGKLVILDFWNIHCANCIAAMPEMQQLQDHFNGQVQIILVTTDPLSQVQSLAQRSDVFRQVKLPSIVQDSSLLALFSIKTVPTHVWISPEGKIDYITNGYNTNEETIRSYLLGNKPHLFMKRELMDIDLDKPLLLEGNGRHLNKMLYYAYLTSQIQTDVSQSGVIKDQDSNQPISVKAINVNILSLFQLAHGHSAISEYNQLNRVVLDIRDKTGYLWPELNEHLDAWKAANLFCYEITVKPAYSNRLFNFMKQDLENFFNVSTSIEVQLRPCWVLVKKSHKTSLKSRGGPTKFSMNRNTSDSTQIQNVPIQRLQDFINGITENFTTNVPPIVDETNIHYAIDLRISNKLTKLSELRRELNASGLDILVKERKIKMLVIRDRN